MSMVILFFRVYTFALLVALIAYLFKRYGLPRLKEDVSQKEREQQELIAHNTVLTAELLQQEKTVEKERLETAALKKKVDLWYVQVQEEIATKAQERECLVEKMQMRCEQQKNYYQVHIQQAQLIPKVLDAAQEQLEQQMAGAQGLAWTERLIKALKEDVA